MSKKCGVYALICNANNRMYIGSSKDLYRRFYGHLQGFETHKNHTKELDDDFVKYGFNEFTFKILKECKEDDLLKYEQKFFDKYKDTTNLYNKRIKVHTNIGINTVKIKMYDLEMNLVKEFKSKNQAIEFLNEQDGFINERKYITKCCSGKVKKAYGYIWKYAS